MNQDIEDILNANFDFSDEDIVIGNILELFKYANNIVNYLNESTNHIPGYESYKEKINKNSKILQDALDEKSNLKRGYAELLNSEKELQKKRDEVDDLKGKINELEQLEVEYANLDMDELKKEYRKLFRLHEEKYKEIGKIEDENKKLKQLIDNFDKNLNELNHTTNDDIEKLKEIFKNIDQHINENWDGLDDRLAVERKRFRTLTEQYSNLLNDTDSTLMAIGSTKRELKIKERELTALLEKYTKLQTVYNKEFEQNSKYIEMNSSKLDALGEELKNGLNQFNGILSEVIAKNEKIKNEIREANR